MTTAVTRNARAVVHRTRGSTNGSITRLMSPGDSGRLLKPFVVLDLFSFKPSAGHKGFGMHGRAAPSGPRPRRHLPQATSERVTQVMHAHPAHADGAACVLPAGVVYRVDAVSSKRENPDRVQAALRLNDRPCRVIEDHHVIAFALERLGWDDKDAAEDGDQRRRMVQARRRAR